MRFVIYLNAGAVGLKSGPGGKKLQEMTRKMSKLQEMTRKIYFGKMCARTRYIYLLAGLEYNAHVGEMNVIPTVAYLNEIVFWG